ncbi:DUF2917 domain-containing protein [Acidovorax sp. SUPP3334]|uniref:DUF2917 domain-containing protein n=1 Tax=Acidovorax sp. SUPP3334 TaxID=2920881 RepID=UPI0023DE4936|nr:DUF2917 domain-containing protein [Acidovorax sp. SUPP3334]GKT26433.1 DUF2917 domain-containing protein [Acidovorax sp. SUPP3334]
MKNHPVLESQQSKTHAYASRTLAGCWTLPPQRALSLRAQQRARLRVQHGGVWITVTGRADTMAQDVFLSAGDACVFEAGSHVVMEPWRASRAGLVPFIGGAEVRFRWDPLPAPVPIQAEAWAGSVAAPWADLLEALRGAAGAAGRLTKGLVFWGVRRRFRAHPLRTACIDAQCE